MAVVGPAPLPGGGSCRHGCCRTGSGSARPRGAGGGRGGIPVPGMPHGIPSRITAALAAGIGLGDCCRAFVAPRASRNAWQARQPALRHLHRLTGADDNFGVGYCSRDTTLDPASRGLRAEPRNPARSGRSCGQYRCRMARRRHPARSGRPSTSPRALALPRIRARSAIAGSETRSARSAASGSPSASAPAPRGDLRCMASGRAASRPSRQPAAADSPVPGIGWLIFAPCAPPAAKANSDRPSCLRRGGTEVRAGGAVQRSAEATRQQPCASLRDVDPSRPFRYAGGRIARPDIDGFGPRRMHRPRADQG